MAAGAAGNALLEFCPDASRTCAHLDEARFYSVPAIIDSLRIDVDIDGGELTGGQAEFSTNGAWTKPTY